MKVAIVGCGATGSKAAKQILDLLPEVELVLIDDRPGAAAGAASMLSSGDIECVVGSDAPADAAVVLLCVRRRCAGALASRCVSRGQHVVSVGDDRDDVLDLLWLDESARSSGATVIAGAGMMPGLSDLLVFLAASRMSEVHEIHVSKFGTGGPDCARQHHRALKGICDDWRDGEMVRRAGGSGRELQWFPSPVESADCYRAALPDTALLARTFPHARRITARMAATRRDRLTMHLPMLRPPHPEGLLGAVRAEVRGEIDGACVDIIVGCSERPAKVAAAVASQAVFELVAGSLRNVDPDSRGAFGLAELVDVPGFLAQLRHRGLRIELFAGLDGQDLGHLA